MRSNVTLFLGVFAVMALSNAIVPVLPAFADRYSWTGAIYAAYFLGAFLSTLPAGILSDRFGRVRLMQTGLTVTIASGIVLFLAAGPIPALAARLAEGIGAGLFVAPALAAVNREEEHEKLSGYFLALLNAGLVLGLAASGALAAASGHPKTGVILFTVLTIVPAIASLFIREPQVSSSGFDLRASQNLCRKYAGVLYSSVILIGITGVAISLYPRYSALPADMVSYWISGMSIATIVAVLLVSRFSFDGIRMILASSLLMAAGIALVIFSPAGLLVLGVTAGLVMVAQMAVLSRAREQQGIAMGLFSTSSYLGMAVLPFLAGLVADQAGIVAACIATALSALTVTVTIGRRRRT